MRDYAKILAVFMLVVLFSGCKGENEGHKSKWKIRLPETYKHVEDKKADKVVQWLQRRPHKRNNLIIPSEKSPYTFEQWVEKLQKMENAELIMLDLLENYSGVVHYDVTLFCLQYVCTYRSVSPLIEIVKDDEYDLDQRLLAAGMLGYIGDPVAVEPIMEAAGSIEIKDTGDEFQDNSLRSAKLKFIYHMCSTNDPRTIAYLDEELKKTYWNDEDLEGLQKERKRVIEQREQFVLDWLERVPWHYYKDNSRELPPFKSKKKWLAAGKKTPGLEKVLVQLLENGTISWVGSGAPWALSGIGTRECVPYLESMVYDTNLERWPRMLAKRALEDNQSEEAAKVLEEMGDLREKLDNPFGIEFDMRGKQYKQQDEEKAGNRKQEDLE